MSQGYKKPYRWASFDDVPFTELGKSLSESRATLVSTSDVAIRGAHGQGRNKSRDGQVGNAYVIPTDTPVESLFSRQEHYDKYATNLDDVNSYFPLTPLMEKVEAGTLKSLAPRCHGVYTAYSQSQVFEVDAPKVLRRCQEDDVDLAVLTPV